MLLKPGKKPHADHCGQLQQAVLAYSELQRHIAADTIPKVPVATLTAESKRKATSYQAMKKKEEEELEQKKRRVEEKEKELQKLASDLEAREADLARRVQAYGKFVEQRG